MKKSFEQINQEKFDLDGNTSHLAFAAGKMESYGTLNNIKIVIDLRYCKGCGICTQECPTGSLGLEQEKGKLRKAIHASCPEPAPDNLKFNPHQLLAWQELPHHGGLIVNRQHDSYNLTGNWRVGEVVVANADQCVLCGLCYLHCPEDIIKIEKITSQAAETGKEKRSGHPNEQQ